MIVLFWLACSEDNLRGEVPMATNAAACTVRYEPRRHADFCIAKPTKDAKGEYVCRSLFPDDDARLERVCADGNSGDARSSTCCDVPPVAHRMACNLASGMDSLFILDIECEMPGVAPEELANMLFGGYYTQITQMFLDEEATLLGAGRPCGTGVSVADLSDAVTRLEDVKTPPSLPPRLASQRKDSRQRLRGYVDGLSDRSEVPLRPIPCDGNVEVKDRLQVITYAPPGSGFGWVRAAVKLDLSQWHVGDGDSAAWYQVFQPIPGTQRFLAKNYGAIELKPSCNALQDVSRCTSMDYVWALPASTGALLPTRTDNLAIDFASRAMRLSGELALCDALGDDPALRAALEPRGLVEIPDFNHPCDLRRGIRSKGEESRHSDPPPRPADRDQELVPAH